MDVAQPVEVEEVENPVETPKKVKKVRKKKVVDPDAPKKPRKANPWLQHVKAYREKHPDVPYKQVLKDAKSSYKKPT